eukprot:CAMPEP_0206498610 /NCGR_PEP_ID=MMETSP0324_2-20121206/51126_1 /ASSEMBLY_ACC=CAM_ASM_000836 /TAXON_ID=2866 /ORGANISM="Crypthecodinium cohnii, Strain Seligo" /LENGTH=40 /DNA_ID= /DNA_START= /DNA_END= /DNA_ORIENTATION=
MAVLPSWRSGAAGWQWTPSHPEEQGRQPPHREAQAAENRT